MEVPVTIRLKIFKQIWIDEITELFVSSINEYGHNTSLQTHPHKNGRRSTSFCWSCLEDIQQFLALSMLGGSVEFSVSRDMFINNPFYSHPIAIFII